MCLQHDCLTAQSPPTDIRESSGSAGFEQAGEGVRCSNKTAAVNLCAEQQLFAGGKIKHTG